MDFKKLSKVADSLEKTPAKRSLKIDDSKIIKSREERKRLLDSKMKRAKSYKFFKVRDSFKNLRKRIKDELEETATTEEAINVAIEALQDAPAEEVLAATIEVLAATIEALESPEETEDLDDLEEEDLEGEDLLEEDLDEIEDSETPLKKKLQALEGNKKAVKAAVFQELVKNQGGKSESTGNDWLVEVNGNTVHCDGNSVFVNWSDGDNRIKFSAFEPEKWIEYIKK